MTTSNCFTSAVALAVSSLLCANSAFADADLIGLFASGTGHWNDVPTGNMESTPSNIPSSFSYDLPGNMYLFISAGASGTASATASAAAVGNLGADILPGSFPGAGIALTYGGVLPVSGGDTIVLSAFVKRVNGPLSTGNIYLDLWDIPGDIAVHVSNTTSQWQFVYGTFTASSFINVGARAVVSGPASPLDEILVDELAITPLADFVPPSFATVPEPTTSVALFSVGLVAFGFARQYVRR